MNSPVLSRKIAAAEIQRRRSIRRSLTEWARYKGFEPARHHRFIIAQVEDFLQSDDEVLLIFAPPGSAKSTYISRLLPASYLANHPTHSILAATHSGDFAERWGRRVRNDVGVDGNILGISLAPDSQAAGRWTLISGGEYYGVGAGAGIAGFRADLAIGDDFFGSREDAYSQTIRENRWEWYLSDFSTRLKPGAKRILMNTRWHEEDVAGRVLDQIRRGEIRGRVVSIPAIAEENDILGRKPGEYLWSGDPKYDYPALLEARRRETSPMMWAALYQQRPAPEEGDYFRREWLHEVETPPPRSEMHVYGGSDYAVTSNGGDYTVHVVLGLDSEGRLYLLDLWRRQASSAEWVEAFCDLVREWKPLGWAEETGQIKSGVGPFLERRMLERQAFVAREQFPTRGDKSVRAQSIRGRIAIGGLYVPHGAKWFEALRSEMLTFPAGKHDDQVDALGLVGQLLDKMVEGVKAKPAGKPENASGYVSARVEDYSSVVI
jgi:predicted phage terminase large subunit-like protein